MVVQAADGAGNDAGGEAVARIVAGATTNVEHHVVETLERSIFQLLDSQVGQQKLFLPAHVDVLVVQVPGMNAAQLR